MLKDKRGLAVSTGSPIALSAYEAAVEDYLAYRKSAGEHLKRAQAEDPDSLAGHCLRAAFLLLFGTRTTYPAVDKAIAAAKGCQGRGTARERLHLEAVTAWRHGDVAEASRQWETIVAEHPQDLLALRLHHFNAFWRGDREALRNIPAGALPAWSEDLPGYGNLLGMLAFGLEENGDYGQAEFFGRTAVALEEDDLWALHAVAHVLEMQGRTGEGLTLLSQAAGTWADRNPFRDHLWWHRALFALEAGEVAQVLELYHREIRPDPSGFYLDVQNAASLLLRLELLQIPVGDLWEPLADIAEERTTDHVLAFTSLHFAMALAAAGREKALCDLREAIAALPETEPGSEIASLARSLLLPLVDAIAAQRQRRFDRVLELLLPLRHRLGPLGASHAQRDIFALLLIEAARKSSQPSLYEALLRERVCLRPGSSRAWAAYGEALALRDSKAAAAALRRAGR